MRQNEALRGKEITIVVGKTRGRDTGKDNETPPASVGASLTLREIVECKQER